MYFETDTLEYKKILTKIMTYAHIERSKQNIMEIIPYNDFDSVKELLEETEEMRKLIVSFGELPYGSGKDILPYIKLCEKGGCLEGINIRDIIDFIKTTNAVKRTKNSLSNQFKFNYLSKYIDELVDLSKLSDDLTRSIDEVGEVVDNATPKLLTLRKSVRMLEIKLRNKLQEILASKTKELTDNVIVIRNDRLCLGVKAEYKNSFKGIIHDQSSSGSTFYIEPISTFEINNQLINEQALEKEEVHKVLLMMSQTISCYSSDLEKNFHFLVELDIINAKAKYGVNFLKPEVNNLGMINLKDAKHPLIDENKVVPLSISLGSKYQTIIITGPNTGGKTVSLKTVGLLTLMMQSGILIPASKAEMAVFDNVFCDIGDEQSIEQSLSTFSSHMSKIVKITESITDNSLVLLDELGGGTDPIEGSALAISLLNYFMEKNARTIITTHYPTLKAYGYEHDKIQNASMEFNEETYMPTYRLLLGISGKSNAFLISKHLGLKDEIIEDANSFVHENSTDESHLMKKIEEEGLYLDKLIQENDNLKKELLRKEKEFDNKIKNIEDKKEEIIKKAHDKAENVYNDAKEKASDLLKEIETLLRENTKEHEIATVKHKIKELKAKEEIAVNERELQIGDFVTIMSYNCIGQITKKNNDKFTVKYGILTSDFYDYELKYSYGKPKDEKPLRNRSELRRSVSPTLDLRGYRYEDAKIALDKYMDDAAYGKLPFVTIIHGFGTGVIKKLVQEYMKSCKYVEKFRYGGMGEGLDGATIAYLKK